MGFEEWEAAAQEDGFMCRRHGYIANPKNTQQYFSGKFLIHFFSRDCDWIEPGLYCQTYEITLRVMPKTQMFLTRRHKTTI